MLKTVSSVANAIGALNYKGTWNASTNAPTLASGVGVQGDYYVVSVAGATNLDGITNWGIGDWATFNGSVWQRVEGGADGNFVNLTADTLNVNGLATVDSFRVDPTATGAVLISAVDQAHARLRIDNLNGQAWDLIAGTAGISNSGFGIYDSDAAAIRIQIDSSGNVSLPTGNLVLASGSGIDFSATAGTGTSELLDDYEEGTWTPVDNSGAGLTITNGGCTYTKVGRLVTLVGVITYPTTVDGSNAQIGGFPFSSGATPIACNIGYQTVAVTLMSHMNGSVTAASFFTPGVNVTNATMSTVLVIFTASYFV